VLRQTPPSFPVLFRDFLRVLLVVKATVTRTAHRQVVVRVLGMRESPVNIAQLRVPRVLIRPLLGRLSAGTDVLIRGTVEQEQAFVDLDVRVGEWRHATSLAGC